LASLQPSLWFPWLFNGAGNNLKIVSCLDEFSQGLSKGL
jgi:hypothetical protein